MRNDRDQKNQFSDQEAARTIRKLTDENKKLSREVESLKKEISELAGKSVNMRHTEKYRSSLKRRSDSEFMFSKRSYPSFLWAHLTKTSFFNYYKRAINFIRRYTFITTTLRVVSVLFLFIETSLLLLISTSALIVSLVSTLITSQALMILTFFARKKQNKRNTQLLYDKNITVFFPPKENALDRDSYFKYIVSDFAVGEDNFSVVVSPFTFKSIGIENKGKAYYMARLDGKNILLVRRNYYFTLKKKIIDKYGRSVTEIY